ncbi:UNVERIFIED_CONTAM: hypothetical protein HDU68_012535 [Siphonaria sp. JEL0065]|nr:hypothetical protein HDU68_012535 [Siphonaria sp. JEL0065]
MDWRSLQVSASSHSLPRLRSLPVEVWELIASLADSNSIIPLSHAVPCLKYISEAICNVGSAFDMPISLLWPDFWLPVQFKYCSKSRPLPVDILPFYSDDDFEYKSNVINVLSRLVANHGGVVKVQAHTLNYYQQIQHLLPRVIDIYIQSSPDCDFYESYHGEDPFGLVVSAMSEKHVIRSLDIPYGEDQDDNDHYLLNPILLEVAKTVKVLRCHNMSLFPFPLLGTELRTVEEIEFSKDSYLDEVPYKDCLASIATHTSLKRVVFEEMLAVECSEAFHGAQCNNELAEIGWTLRDGVGGIYGNPCVVWERQRQKPPVPKCVRKS